ncbi:MAG: hypothetical protein RR572_07810 [Raoultibacter sp.]
MRTQHPRPPAHLRARQPAHPLREGGNILVLLAVTLSTLFALLAFGVDASAVIAQKMQQENALNLARETIMAPTITLEAKNAEDPGALIARTLVRTLRDKNYAGTIELWFYEAGRPEVYLPDNRRIFAYELAVSDTCEPAFSRIFGIREIPVASCLVTSSSPYAEYKTWRPNVVRSGVFRLEAGRPAAYITFATASLASMPQDIQKEIASCIDDSN